MPYLTSEAGYVIKITEVTVNEQSAIMIPQASLKTFLHPDCFAQAHLLSDLARIRAHWSSLPASKTPQPIITLP